MSTSPQTLEESVIFFLDRTHQSRVTVKLLRTLGLRIELHNDHFAPDAPDDEWTPVCAAKGWIILTGDKGIENSGINRAAVIKCAAKVFMIYDHKTRSLEQAAALIAARKKIMLTALQNVGPFYCAVEMASDKHVGVPRFYPGGHAIEVSQLPVSALPTPKTSERSKNTKRSFMAKSGNLEFNN